MSISRWRKSRGFSIVAAFVFAALLTLAAVAVQSTIPTMTTPASQGAQAGSTDVTLVANKATTQATAQSKAPIFPGKDVVTILISNQPQVNLYFPVCPQSEAGPTAKMKAFAKFLQEKDSSSKFGIPETRCKDDPDSKTNPKQQIPVNPGAWPQWTYYCNDKAIPTGSTNAPQAGTTKNITDTDVSAILQDANSIADLCKVLPPGTQSSKSPTEIQQLAQTLASTPPSQQAALIQGQNLSQADQNALTQALTQQKDDLKTNTDNLVAKNNDIDNQLATLANGDCSRSIEANPTTQAAAAGEVAQAVTTYNPCQPKIDDLNAQKAANQAQIDANKKQLDNLAAAQVPLTASPDVKPAPDNPNNPNTPAPGPTTPTQSTAPARPSGSNPFSNPSIGANNTPQSPFGGACNTRYICSGNTLYYQSYGGQLTSYNPIVMQQGQCQTQPVQQCPYGCQQINTTAGQSTLNDIGAGLQFVSSVMKIFGGGGANNTAVNNNLPSQCAMTPQQGQYPQQSPFGTGTNGQPCYQPPPQPDPSQCTSGTWQPTAGQQNGCTTGWQCVPSGTGSAGTKPTAQLSCQPQIADVGQPISFSFSCANASGSAGTGFSTGGALSGSATTPAPTPPSGQNIGTFTLTCVNQGVTASAQCQVQLSKSGIVLVTNPKTVRSGDTSLIGWITSGMQSCVVSSPDQQDFTARNANNTSANGAATTSPITGTTRFQLDCQTVAGGTKSATTTVTLN